MEINGPIRPSVTQWKFSHVLTSCIDTVPVYTEQFHFLDTSTPDFSCHPLVLARKILS